MGTISTSSYLESKSSEGILRASTFHIIKNDVLKLPLCKQLCPNASLAMMYQGQQITCPCHANLLHTKSIPLRLPNAACSPPPHHIDIRRVVAAQAVLFTTNTPTSIPSLAASHSAYGLSFTPSHTSRTRSEAVTSSILPEAFILCGNMSPLLKYERTTFVILSLS